MAAVVRPPSTVRLMRLLRGVMVQDGAEGQEVAVRTKHNRAINAGDVLQHGGRNIEHALVAQQVVQLVFAGDAVRAGRRG